MAKVDINIVDKSVVWTDNSESPEIVVDQESAKISGVYYAHREIVAVDDSGPQVSLDDPLVDPVLGIYYAHREVITNDDSAPQVSLDDPLVDPVMGIYYAFREVVIFTPGFGGSGGKKGSFSGRAIVPDAIKTFNDGVVLTGFDPSEDL